MDELQKQLVRIFGSDTVVTPTVNREDNEEFTTPEESPDILQEMREKPATPLLRLKQRENNPKDDEFLKSQDSNGRSTDEDFRQMVANKKYSVGGTLGKSHKAGEILINKDSGDSESILEDEFLSQESSLSES